MFANVHAVFPSAIPADPEACAFLSGPNLGSLLSCLFGWPVQGRVEGRLRGWPVGNEYMLSSAALGAKRRLTFGVASTTVQAAEKQIAKTSKQKEGTQPNAQLIKTQQLVR